MDVDLLDWANDDTFLSTMDTFPLDPTTFTTSTDAFIDFKAPVLHPDYLTTATSSAPCSPDSAFPASPEQQQQLLLNSINNNNNAESPLASLDSDALSAITTGSTTPTLTFNSTNNTGVSTGMSITGTSTGASTPSVFNTSPIAPRAPSIFSSSKGPIPSKPLLNVFPSQKSTTAVAVGAVGVGVGVGVGVVGSPVSLLPSIARIGEDSDLSAKRARTTSTTQYSSANISIDPSLLEDQNQKKQRRMLKNRESACLSRRRKKEHMEGLERQVADVVHEREGMIARIAQLEAENAALKKELELVRGSRVKPTTAVTAAAGTTCLLAVFVLFSLFSTPSPSLSHTSSGSSLTPLGLGHSRQVGALAPVALSSSSSSSSPSSSSSERTLKSIAQRGDVMGRTHKVAATHKSLMSHEIAPRAMPSSDHRTHEEIDRWVQQQKAKLRSTDGDHDLTTEFTLSRNISLPPLYRLSDSVVLSMFDFTSYKPDTSYIFCTEARILSAHTPRSDQPRMSLVMPAPSILHAKSTNNATLITNNAMQVDCDILQSTPITFNVSSTSTSSIPVS